MHKAFANILKCPNCGNTDLSINEENCNKDDIIEGSIRCPECNMEFIIENRVANLLHNLSQTCIDEIEATNHTSITSHDINYPHKISSISRQHSSK